MIKFFLRLQVFWKSVQADVADALAENGRANLRMFFWIFRGHFWVKYMRDLFWINFPVHTVRREGKAKVRRITKEFPFLDLLQKVSGDVRRSATFYHKQCIRDLSSAFHVECSHTRSYVKGRKVSRQWNAATQRQWKKPTITVDTGKST